MKKMLLALVFTISSFTSSFAFAGKKLDIVDTAVAAGKFTTLVTAVKAADLVSTLKSPGPFTVFAPTDKAFAKLPAGTVDYLLKNTEQLKDILLYHVALGSLFAKDVVQLDEAPTVFGDLVQIEVKNDGVFLNNAKVIMTDIKASNGVIHVIDTVLIP